MNQILGQPTGSLSMKSKFSKRLGYITTVTANSEIENKNLPTSGRSTYKATDRITVSPPTIRNGTG